MNYKTPIQSRKQFLKACEERAKTPLAVALAEMGVTCAPSYCGLHTDAEKWEAFNWSVHIQRAGRPAAQFVTPYRAGIAHCHNVSHTPDTSPVYSHKDRDARPNPPAVYDVLYGLLLDAGSATNTFENWCADFGHDSDSRKALAVYLACQEDAGKLAKMFTPAELEKLQEAAQNY